MRTWKNTEEIGLFCATGCMFNLCASCYLIYSCFFRLDLEVLEGYSNCVWSAAGWCDMWLMSVGNLSRLPWFAIVSWLMLYSRLLLCQFHSCCSSLLCLGFSEILCQFNIVTRWYCMWYIFVCRLRLVYESLHVARHSSPVC